MKENYLIRRQRKQEKKEDEERTRCEKQGSREREARKPIENDGRAGEDQKTKCVQEKHRV